MKVQSRVQERVVSAICTSNVILIKTESLPAPANPVSRPLSWGPAKRWISPPRDQWRLTKNPTHRGLDLTEKTKLSSLTLTVCPGWARWIPDLSCIWHRQSLLIDDGPAHLPLPIISALGQWSPLKSHPCYQSPSPFLSSLLSSAFFFCPSISSSVLVRGETELCVTLFQSPSIYLSYFIFLHLRAFSLSLLPSLPRQLWSKLISWWFCEMLIDWTV